MAMTSVLAAVSETDEAAAVLKMAALIAGQFGARLSVVRSVAVPQDIPPAAHTSAPDVLPSLIAATTDRELQALIAREIPGAAVEPPLVVESHHPWRAVLDAA